MIDWQLVLSYYVIVSETHGGCFCSFLGRAVREQSLSSWLWGPKPCVLEGGKLVECRHNDHAVGKRYIPERRLYRLKQGEGWWETPPEERKLRPIKSIKHLPSVECITLHTDCITCKGCPCPLALGAITKTPSYAIKVTCNWVLLVSGYEFYQENKNWHI